MIECLRNLIEAHQSPPGRHKAVVVKRFYLLYM